MWVSHMTNFEDKPCEDSDCSFSLWLSKWTVSTENRSLSCLVQTLHPWLDVVKSVRHVLWVLLRAPPPFTIPTHLDSRTTTRDARRSIGSLLYVTSHAENRCVDSRPHSQNISERYVEKTDTIKELYFDRTKTINRRCSRWNGDLLNHHRWFCKFSFWDKRPPSLHGREKWIKP